MPERGSRGPWYRDHLIGAISGQRGGAKCARASGAWIKAAMICRMSLFSVVLINCGGHRQHYGERDQDAHPVGTWPLRATGSLAPDHFAHFGNCHEQHNPGQPFAQERGSGHRPISYSAEPNRWLHCSSANATARTRRPMFSRAGAGRGCPSSATLGGNASPTPVMKLPRIQRRSRGRNQRPSRATVSIRRSARFKKLRRGFVLASQAIWPSVISFRAAALIRTLIFACENESRVAGIRSRPRQSMRERRQLMDRANRPGASQDESTQSIHGCPKFPQPGKNIRQVVAAQRLAEEPGAA